MMEKFDDLGLISLEEELYRADISLLEHYHHFSAELLRLALVGVASFGFLLQQFQIGLMSRTARLAALVAMILLVLSGASSLAHRFLSSDGMFHHIRLLRLCRLAKKTQDAAAQQAVEALSKQDRETRARRYKTANFYLGLSSVLLALGIVALATCMIVLLLHPPPLRGA
jgi:Ca2+/Na+ antiporter